MDEVQVAPRPLAAVFEAQAGTALPTEDVLHLLLPLMREVAALHAADRVAALGLNDVVEAPDGSLKLARSEGVAPVIDTATIRRVQPAATSALKVVGEYRVTTDEAEGASVLDLDTAEEGADEVTKPVYLAGLRSWEIAVGHHDEITDVFLLGLILAALACGFDPADREALARFSLNRANLFALEPRLHPVLAGLIVEATALNRHDRATDVAELARRLERYREQPAGLAVEQVLDSAGAGLPGRREAVLTHLRDRLFDLSRRNRLLHFKPTAGSVNLTEASVPLVVRLESIRAEQLCTWDGQFVGDVLGGKPLLLNRWLRFEDQPHLPAAFDKLIGDARRDKAEYGFSPLRLVVAFLRWHNLKDAPEERIVSPLLWLPVEVSRAKGVRDRYVLRCTETVAEFNPALRHQLRQLYDIQLPEEVDLATTDVAAVHADLLRQIGESEPGVTLNLQRRPAIRLILQRAVQRVAQFNRRRGGAKQAQSTVTDFSYARDDYRPLGHALFEKFVRPSPLPQRLAAGGHLRPRPDYMVAQTEGQSFALGVDDGHRFAWEVDLTQVTLANFNYKKMSLVRDYAELIDGRIEQPAFDRVFSVEPRPLERAAPPPIPLADRWGVVAADATQDAAVALARTGESFIIQGPPGTGKSQTITNLIADYAARGKRVLFVCEKRAALDVVFHRLGQAGLDGLSCIIHDSQEDKKGFIADLKDRYEFWSKHADGLEEAEAAREHTVALLAEMHGALAAFHDATGAVEPDAAASLRALIRRAAALPDAPGGYGPTFRESLPTLARWDAARGAVERVARLARDLGETSFAAHPFARLTAAAVGSERPVSAVEAAIDAGETRLAALDAWLDGGSLFADGGTPLGVARTATAHAAAMRATGLAASPALLDPGSPESAELARDQARLAALIEAAAEAQARAAGWSDPLAPADLDAGLLIARRHETSFLRFFSGEWRRLKATVHARYDFAVHGIAPSVTAVLEMLAGAQRARAERDAEGRRLAERYRTADLPALVAARAALLEALPRDPATRRMVDAARAAPDGDARLAAEAARAETVAALVDGLATALDGAETLTFDDAGELLRDLREALDELPAALPALVELDAGDADIARLLRHVPLPPAGLEALLVDEAIARVRRAHPDVQRFDIDRLLATTRAASGAEEQLRRDNSATIRARRHAHFREQVRRSTLALSQLDADGRRFKADYGTGRRELEHEFGKTMRYRSIRDLADDETGAVVRDLKPIWLMSPLSVSDTLPVAPDLFDMVIFDEASQVPTEDAVPALSRAPQVVIVGDEMQLPPTSFFATAATDEEAEVVAEEDGERIAILLDADSLLAQSARNLPATMLAWHYRSRSESLISFSNAAFYGGRLVTIPDRTLAGGDGATPAIAVEDEVAWETGVDRLLGAPITTHRLDGSVYERRVNPGEARYIAGLVRAFLRRETGLSLGIVAFSEAQQGEIEAALERLAADNKDFAAQLETEMAREDDGQFNGLFVKNLENVQGDERDVMVMSICYAPGRDGRMAMNFGPINQRGGEKRLNVIFSRARRHMAIVSSVAPTAITNVHNDGARALRSFLSFADAQSEGARDVAQAVLATLNPSAARTFDTKPPADPVRALIAEALRARGHVVHEHVGGASFRCDLGIVDAAGTGYALGVLLDHDRDRAVDPGERYLFRPTILRAFGWRVLDVPVSAWAQAREQVIARIETELRRDSWAAEPVAPPAPVPAPAPLTMQTAEEPATAALTEYRLQQGASDKFWRVGVDGTDLVVEFGRTGTKGQRVVKSFNDADRARREAAKLTLEKTRKGYAEAG